MALGTIVFVMFILRTLKFLPILLWSNTVDNSPVIIECYLFLPY